ncbi:pyridoxal phosphate-dependent aminotransferase [bacterium]|nr:MAG: pyridoxal phosphate-dependent aminotransferase [bacterium]
MLKPFIPDSPFLQQSKLRQIFEKAPADAINLAIGQPGEDTPAFIREAAAKAAKEAPLGYTLNAGIVSLREKIASEFKASISPQQICLTAGVQEALYATFYLMCSNAPADILLPNPGFLTYPALAGLQSCSPRYYHLKAESNFQFRADAVLSELRPETRAVLIAHPSNPTGSDAPFSEYQKLIAGLKNRKDAPVWIIADEVYFGMSYSSDSASFESFLEEYPYIILLRGASKSHHMTGWRLAWAVLPQDLIKPFIATHQYVCTCVSALTQYTFLEIRGSEAEQNWLAYQKELYRGKRDLVYQKLNPHFDLKGGEGAFYWMMNVTEFLTGNQTDEDMCWKLLQEGKVTTAPGSAFGSEANNYLRLSYGPPTAKLEEGLNRIIEFFRR